MFYQWIQDFVFYFKIGWGHIISKDALDHQLFISALAAIFTYKDAKQVLILVTAFTIGHSLTLALSVLDVIRFQSKWVEFLIPCTIFITALSNLIFNGARQRNVRINYVLALSFGLIHGMGFANTIRIMLAKDETLGWGLFGFNVGLEVGQILVVMMILTLAAVMTGVFRIRQKDWLFFLSSGAFALALKMAIERIPF